MSRRIKQAIITNVSNALVQAADVLVVNLATVSAVQLNLFRRELGRMGIKALSAKSDLVAVACKSIGRPGLSNALRCPVTLVYGGVDLFDLCHATTKLCAEFKGTVVGGLSDSTALDAVMIDDISKGKSRKGLLEQLASSLLLPGGSLVATLNCPGEILASAINSLDVETV